MYVQNKLSHQGANATFTRFVRFFPSGFTIINNLPPTPWKELLELDAVLKNVDDAYVSQIHLIWIVEANISFTRSVPIKVGTATMFLKYEHAEGAQLELKTSKYMGCEGLYYHAAFTANENQCLSPLMIKLDRNLLAESVSELKFRLIRNKLCLSCSSRKWITAVAGV